MTDILWRSLDSWPSGRTPTTKRKSATFKAPYNKTLDGIERELTRIGAKDAIVEVDIAMRELRRTGEPLARAAVRSTPGIVLRYTSKDGRAVTMPLDAFDEWHDNLRALYLTLVALRAVDRFGATSSGEQYRGWQALTSITTPSMSTAEAARKLVSFAGGKDSESAVLASASTCRDVLRAAMARTHPDKHMGDVRDFQLVSECKRIMQAHHGVDL